MQSAGWHWANAAQSHDLLEVKCPKARKSALAFWDDQGFQRTGEEEFNSEYDVVKLVRDI